MFRGWAVFAITSIFLNGIFCQWSMFWRVLVINTFESLSVRCWSLLRRPRLSVSGPDRREDLSDGRKGMIGTKLLMWFKYGRRLLSTQTMFFLLRFLSKSMFLNFLMIFTLHGQPCTVLRLVNEKCIFCQDPLDSRFSRPTDGWLTRIQWFHVYAIILSETRVERDGIWQWDESC